MAQSQRCSRSIPPAAHGCAHTLRCSLIGRAKPSRNVKVTCAGAPAQSSPPRQRGGRGRRVSGAQPDTTLPPEPLPQHLESPLTHADILRQELSLDGDRLQEALDKGVADYRDLPKLRARARVIRAAAESCPQWSYELGLTPIGDQVTGAEAGPEAGAAAAVGKGGGASAGKEKGKGKKDEQPKGVASGTAIARWLTASDAAVRRLEFGALAWKNDDSREPATAPVSGGPTGSGGASTGRKPEDSSRLFAVTQPRMWMSRIMNHNKAEWEAVAPGYGAWLQEQPSLQLDSPPAPSRARGQQLCHTGRGDQQAQQQQRSRQQQQKKAAGQEAGHVVQAGVEAASSAGSGDDDGAGVWGLFGKADPEQRSSSSSSSANMKARGGGAAKTRRVSLLLDDSDSEAASGAGGGEVECSAGSGDDDVMGFGGLFEEAAPERSRSSSGASRKGSGGSAANTRSASLLLEDLGLDHKAASGAGGGEEAGGTAASPGASPAAPASPSASTSGAKKNPKGGKGMMFATTTTQVASIWKQYFTTHLWDLQQQGQGQGEQEGQEGSGTDAAGPLSSRQPVPRQGANSSSSSKLNKSGDDDAGKRLYSQWELEEPRPMTLGSSSSSSSSSSSAAEGVAATCTTGRIQYGSAMCGSTRLTPGTVVRLPVEPGAGLGDEDGTGAASSWVAMVQCIYTTDESTGLRQGGRSSSSRGRSSTVGKEHDPVMPYVQLRTMLYGKDTVLGDVGPEDELYLLDWDPYGSRYGQSTAVESAAVVSAAAAGRGAGEAGLWDPLFEVPLAWLSEGQVQQTVCTARPSGHEHRRTNWEADQQLMRDNAARRAAGQPAVLPYRHVYCPARGAFRQLRLEELELGSYVQVAPEPEPLTLLPDGSGFTKHGVVYRVGDFMYVRHEALAATAAAQAASAAGGAVAPSDASAVAANGIGGLSGSEGATSGSEGDGALADGEDETEEGMSDEAGEEEEEQEEDKEDEEGMVSESESTMGLNGTSGKTVAGSKRSGKHKGSTEGLYAWQVVQLLAVEDGQRAGAANVTRAAAAALAQRPRLRVRRFFRPEHMSREVAYSADWWDLYAPAALGSSGGGGSSSSDGGGSSSDGAEGTEEDAVSYDDVYGRCHVVVRGSEEEEALFAAAGADTWPSDTFVVAGTYDPHRPGVVGPPPLPSALELPDPFQFDETTPEPTRQQQRGRVQWLGEGQEQEQERDRGSGGSSEDVDGAAEPLAAMDLFAGCGGLSEGFEQSGVSRTRWAIEYLDHAAKSFAANHPEAAVFCDNVNVLLKAAMDAAGEGPSCHADPEAAAAAAAMPREVAAALPRPGQVGLMTGGPPCQGFSGMNRFNRGDWSQVQNSMVLAYLSYADFYRPRYFLLENVRNLVAYNKGLMFRLILRTLLDLGYQVRFGVLDAGHYGVPQSRKRTFIWAALPGEALPEWPAPRHAFGAKQLNVDLPYPPLPYGSQHADVRSGLPYKGRQGKKLYSYRAAPLLPGAPLRTVTVRDAIGDLPEIDNGDSKEVLPYPHPRPPSAYQRAMRSALGQGASGNGTDSPANEVWGHVCKSMIELNQERCRNIPVGELGADWRALQRLVQQDPTKAMYKGEPLVPNCLVNTAHRHNGWRGLFGRLDPDGHFPTIVTDPNPMGKVGQVFHPTQHRIASVREYARGQGFPDHYIFEGKIKDRHLQVGNAVPPPLARALGRQLQQAVAAGAGAQGRAGEAGGGPDTDRGGDGGEEATRN